MSKAKFITCIGFDSLLFQFMLITDCLILTLNVQASGNSCCLIAAREFLIYAVM
jgi:hypothetical protein